jgi:hypothetical protein
MGGYGSGRNGGRPTADMSLRVDLAWMIRTGKAKPGSLIWGSLSWTCGGEPSGSISYETDMTDPDNARLILKYRRGSGDTAEQVRQEIILTYSQPHYGGRRWWMMCPYGGGRSGKLYLPPGGDRFASRKAWRLGYQSQRIAERDRPFEALFRLQKKLGGRQGWEGGLERRPKGMWHRTYKRHWEEYFRLDRLCANEAAWAMKLMDEFR